MIIIMMIIPFKMAFMLNVLSRIEILMVFTQVKFMMNTELTIESTCS